MNFIPARCPSCGGELMIPDDMKKVICSHCGTNFLLEQTKSQELTPTIENWLKMADTALEGNNSKEALGYYNKILEVDSGHWIAWFGKGRSAALESTIANFTFDEMLLSFDRALKCVPDEKRQELLDNILRFSGKFLKAFSRAVGLHYAKYCRNTNSVNELIRYDETICQKIDILYKMDSNNVGNCDSIDLGIDIATELLNGYEYVDYSQDYIKYRLPQYARDIWKARYDKYLHIMKILDPSYEPYTKLA